MQTVMLHRYSLLIFLHPRDICMATELLQCETDSFLKKCYNSMKCSRNNTLQKAVVSISLCGSGQNKLEKQIYTKKP